MFVEKGLPVILLAGEEVMPRSVMNVIAASWLGLACVVACGGHSGGSFARVASLHGRAPGPSSSLRRAGEHPTGRQRPRSDPFFQPLTQWMTEELWATD
jgi:hypothetical protein